MPGGSRSNTWYGLTKEEFIAWHVQQCGCSRVKKYDSKKPEHTLHSLAYSRRKCAKKLWKDIQRRDEGSEPTPSEIMAACRAIRLSRELRGAL